MVSAQRIRTANKNNQTLNLTKKSILTWIYGEKVSRVTVNHLFLVRSQVDPQRIRTANKRFLMQKNEFCSWEDSSAVELGAVNSAVVGSIPTPPSMKSYTINEFFYDTSFKDYVRIGVKNQTQQGYVFVPYLIMETRPIAVESISPRRTLVSRYAINI